MIKNLQKNKLTKKIIKFKILLYLFFFSYSKNLKEQINYIYFVMNIIIDFFKKNFKNINYFDD